nr:hypothetical protein [Candidatus Cloacimonadota bacterium]
MIVMNICMKYIIFIGLSRESKISLKQPNFCLLNWQDYEKQLID